MQGNHQQMSTINDESKMGWKSKQKNERGCEMLQLGIVFALILLLVFGTFYVLSPYHLPIRFLYYYPCENGSKYMVRVVNKVVPQTVRVNTRTKLRNTTSATILPFPYRQSNIYW